MKFRFIKVFFICVVGMYANVNIETKQDIVKVKKGLASVTLQEQKKIKKIKLKKYFLARTLERPSFFESNDIVYEFYLAAFLQRGHPVWLENDNFVFNTSSNKNYLKRVQKNYAKKYKIDLILYTNEKFWKKTYARRKVNIEDMKSYIDNEISLSSEKTLQKKKIVQEKKIKTLPLISAKVQTKQDIKKLQQGIHYLQKQVESKTTSVSVKKYFLAKTVQKPSFFGSMDPIYNLYLTSILNNGTATWLEDGRFVFHTSNGRKYLKSMQKFYKKKYHLALTLYRNPGYKKENLAIMPTDLSDVIVSLKNYIPQELQKKNKVLPIEKKEIKNLPLLEAKVKTKQDVKNIQDGIRHLQKQVEEKTKNVSLKKYFLAKTVQKPSFFGSMDPIYNLYLTSILNNGTATWLEDGRFVFHTSNGRKYLKSMQKFYKKKYHLALTLYRNPHYKKENLVLMPTDLSDVIVSLQSRIPEKLIENMAKGKKRKVLKKQKIKTRIRERKILEKKKLKKEQKNSQKQEDEKKKLRKKVLEDEKKRVSEEKRKLETEKRALEAEKRKIDALKKVLAQEKEFKIQAEKEIERKKAKKEAMNEEKKHFALEKTKMEAEKKALAEEKEKLEVYRKKEQIRKKEKEIQKRELLDKKKQDDALTSDLDAMLKDTKDFKKKLERSESIKYY